MYTTMHDQAARVPLYACRLEHALRGKFTLTACCRRCGHEAALSAEQLARRFAPTEKLGAIEKRLRCSCCGLTGRLPYAVELLPVYPP